jgi:hypothetical protein
MAALQGVVSIWAPAQEALLEAQAVIYFLLVAQEGQTAGLVEG